MSANLKSQLDSTVDTYVQYINVDTAATVSSVKNESKFCEMTKSFKFFRIEKSMMKLIPFCENWTNLSNF